ncbi:MAG: YcbK family protein [Deltaproteobacteria bacterium]|nr:YcbK family protein [Deltaproteobacteria bacterium]
MPLRIFLIISALAFFASHSYAAALPPFPQGDGSITFYNYHTGEVLDVSYRAGQKYNKNGIKKIQHIFRSRSDDLEHKIELNLIDLLDNIQDHFKADAIELISGYRSPELNKQLKAEGQNVSEQSLHMEGKAADIHIDEISEGEIVIQRRILSMSMWESCAIGICLISRAGSCWVFKRGASGRF